MYIADSLRQEDMPEMVYSLCKLAAKHYNKDTIQQLMTMNVHTENHPFPIFYKFSLDCGFIQALDNGTVDTPFSETQLSSFRTFRYAVFQNVFKNYNSLFTQTAKWYLALEIPYEPEPGETIFGITSSSEFLQFKHESLKIDENFYNGFRFWMSALGLTAYYPQAAKMPLAFATHRILEDWIRFSTPYAVGSVVPARSFFEKLVQDCPVFENCVDDNSIKASLSSGLRVLDSKNVIQLRRMTDAGDVWHLTKSIVYSDSNDITDIIICEG